MKNLSFPSKLQTLFKGRTGYCLFDGKLTVQKLVTAIDFENHLNGSRRLGVFPIVENEFTNFFVIDIDINDEKICDHVSTLLLLDDVTPCTERSKSKGYHVWVFLTEKTHCSKVRLYMKSILERADLKNNIDLFPRQDRAGVDGCMLGNAINLPFFNLYNDSSTTRNRFLLDEGVEDQRSLVDNIKFTNVSVLEKLIDDLPKPQKESEELQIEMKDNIDHEEETLIKLLSVCKKTNTLRSKAAKAEKTNRSLQDTVYSKHLGELMFSEKLIASEIKSISPKYNDPSLRGSNKQRYLDDKSQHMKFLKEIFFKKSEVVPTSSELLFDYADENFEQYLTTKKINNKRIGKIDKGLLTWLEVDMHLLMQGEYFAISAGCGAGKSM